MLRAAVAVAALAITSFAVGCAEPVAVDEGSGSTTSHITSDNDGYSATLARLERRIDDCYILSNAEEAELRRLTPGPFSFSAQVYAYVSCKVEAGEIVSTSVSVEHRAGWSTDDGTFGETAVTAETSLNIPIRVVTASGSVAYEHTVRTSNGVTYSKDTSSVGVGVERNFALAKASVSASFDGESATITGGLASPIEIPMAACGEGGTGSFGVRIDVSATRVESDIPADVRHKAGDLLVQYADNQWVYQTVGRPNDRSEEARDICCGAQHTCKAR